MFPSSHGGGGSSSGGGLTRYGSAPSSLLTTAVGSTSTRELSSPAPVGFQTRFFPSETSDGPMANQNDAVEGHGRGKTASTFSGFDGGSSSLPRHNSSPPAPGLVNQLAASARGNHVGYSIGRDMRRGDDQSRMNPELNFSTQESHTHRFEDTQNGHRKPKHSYNDSGVGVRQWDNTHPIVFSAAQNKHDTLNMESQFQFSLGMTSMEKAMNIPEDSIPCKIRAKRGCATHPRSIAERERRTRISGKLKKLHDLVPNMDKQTSYADMLDLAVQHIKTLQTKVQKLHTELESCTCGCKNTPHL